MSASKDSTVKVRSGAEFFQSCHIANLTPLVLQVWNLKTYKLHTDLPGHTDEVYCVDFVADKIVSGGRDKTVKMWVVEFHQVVFTKSIALH